MMITDREQFIHGLYDDLLRLPKQVLSIFIDYFGEDRVDLQGFPDYQKLEQNIEKLQLGACVHSSTVASGQEELWATYRDSSVFSLPNEALYLWFPAIKQMISSLFFTEIIILIKFGEVRVTNEHDKFVDIQGLWARVGVNPDGTYGTRLGLNRSEYSFLHLRNNYMHSHISSIPTGNFQVFQNPCLGDGPIIGTMSSLATEFDELRWQLLCLELDNYVHTESLRGGPYHHLETLRENDSQTTISDFTMTVTTKTKIERYLSQDKTREFIEYFIQQGKLKFNYTNGSYGIALPFLEYMILISNVFIEWYNLQYNAQEVTLSVADLLYRDVLQKGIITDNVLYISTSANANYAAYMEYQGKKVCTFKGQDIVLQVLGNTSNVENSSLILNRDIAEGILAQILKIINLKYGK